MRTPVAGDVRQEYDGRRATRPNDMPLCIVAAGPDAVVRCCSYVLAFGGPPAVPAAGVAPSSAQARLGAGGFPAESVGHPGVSLVACEGARNGRSGAVSLCPDSRVAPFR